MEIVSRRENSPLLFSCFLFSVHFINNAYHKDNKALPGWQNQVMRQKTKAKLEIWWPSGFLGSNKSLEINLIKNL